MSNHHEIYHRCLTGASKNLHTLASKVGALEPSRPPLGDQALPSTASPTPPPSAWTWGCHMFSCHDLGHHLVHVHTKWFMIYSTHIYPICICHVLFKWMFEPHVHEDCLKSVGHADFIWISGPKIWTRWVRTKKVPPARPRSSAGQQPDLFLTWAFLYRWSIPISAYICDILIYCFFTVCTYTRYIYIYIHM